jgi:predicted  nucleic acid-binding Zn-ribbon protein
MVSESERQEILQRSREIIAGHTPSAAGEAQRRRGESDQTWRPRSGSVDLVFKTHVNGGSAEPPVTVSAPAPAADKIFDWSSLGLTPEIGDAFDLMSEAIAEALALMLGRVREDRERQFNQLRDEGKRQFDHLQRECGLLRREFNGVRGELNLSGRIAKMQAEVRSARAKAPNIEAGLRVEIRRLELDLARVRASIDPKQAEHRQEVAKLRKAMDALHKQCLTLQATVLKLKSNQAQMAGWVEAEVDSLSSAVVYRTVPRVTYNGRS